MIVVCTELLKELYSEKELKVLISNFAKWKSSGDEYSSFFFGKDADYALPKLDDGALRHVHMVPIDVPVLDKWKKAWRKRGRKVSDSALIYVIKGKDKFLLIYFISEKAHEIAQMKSKDDLELMKFLGQIAEAFIDHNDIIA